MARAGWTRADDLSFRTGWLIVRSTLGRRSYLEAPVSPLLLFGRVQDFAYQQEVDGTPGTRHHVRFWRCPPGWLLPGGRRVDWLAAGTYDRSVGVSLFTLQVTHRIDENTDAERDHVVASVTAADPRATATVLRDFSTGYHSRNGGGDAIVTDGDLPVVDLTSVGSGDRSEADARDGRDRRPPPIIVGAALVAARAVSAAILAVAVAQGWPPAVADLPAGSGDRLLAIAIVIGSFAVAESVFAALVFVGSNAARVLAMTASSVAIIIQAIGAAAGGPGITLQSTLPGLTFDVLLLLALSSSRARAFARRPTSKAKRMPALPGDTAGA